MSFPTESSMLWVVPFPLHHRHWSPLLFFHSFSFLSITIFFFSPFSFHPLFIKSVPLPLLLLSSLPKCTISLLCYLSLSFHQKLSTRMRTAHVRRYRKPRVILFKKSIWRNSKSRGCCKLLIL